MPTQEALGALASEELSYQEEAHATKISRKGVLELLLALGFFTCPKV